IRLHVERLAFVGTMPAVDFRLQGIAHREQLAILGREIADDGGKPGPERIGRNSGPGGRFLGDEVEQDGSDLQSVGVDTIHGKTLAKAAVTRYLRAKTRISSGENKERRKRRRSRPLLAPKPGP